MGWNELYEILGVVDKELEWKDVDQFIKEFDYPEGCEAIINLEGEIAYASPSHIEALIKYSGESRDVIYDKMPLDAMPIKWLVEYTKCISVWPDGIILPKAITESQQVTVRKLIKCNLVVPNQY